MSSLRALRRGWRLLLIALFPLLTACGVSTTDELANWMA